LKRIVRNIFTVGFLILIFSIAWKMPANVGDAGRYSPYVNYMPPPDSLEDSIDIVLPYPFQDQGNYPVYSPADSSKLFLSTPSNISSGIEYDPETNQYKFTNKIGDFNYRNPTTMSFSEYQDYEMDQLVKQYWSERAKTSASLERQGIIPSIYIGGELFDRIFGSNTVDIRPNGSAELIFGVLANSRDDPTLDVRQRRTANFDFDMNIQMNVAANIGDKISFNTNLNTEAIFDFENKLKLNYEGEEDEIIKLIEAGNVSMPLNTTLIQGTQSLFGIKGKFQFGKTTVTALFSQQESETKSVTVQDGAQTSEFSLLASDYEDNKHFFIGHLFRETYDVALSELPIINSSVNITRIEVWVTNIGPATQENRNIVAFQDIGEHSRIHNEYVHPVTSVPYPANNTNDLLINMNLPSIRDINNVTNYMNGDPLGVGASGYMVAGTDYEKVENARLLLPSEYTYNSKLGFISVFQTLNSDQALAVAFQYSVIGVDSVFQVGEFSDQTANSKECLVTKLLKSTALSTQVPMWDLMMKNVYSIGAYRVGQENFILNILYSGNENGVPTGYLTNGPENVKGVPLIEVLNLDNLESQKNPPGDGVFDIINQAATQGGTINSANGRVYFTVIEPFGSYLRDQFGSDYPEEANYYAFDTLYRATKTIAEQQADKNKYLIEGFYSSESGNEIDLGAFNVPKGSVKVTAGGRELQENVDYTVDYTLGRVRIINEGVLNSGVPINISTENQSMFSIQNKRLMGVNFNHDFSKEFRFGGTLMNLTERPLTQKVDYGNDPISNTIWGLDFSYQTESRLITKLVDALPGIDTKAPSKVNVEGEFAHFIPGHSSAIGKDGTVYVDDFEGAVSTIDLRNVGTWYTASTPQGQSSLFPESHSGDLSYGYNRAKLSWYIIDPLFYDRNNNLRPSNITTDEINNHQVREVYEREVFPFRDNPNNIPTNIPVFNMSFYPDERGPYNYDVTNSAYSSGINEDGTLIDPETRWGGIMRRIESTDFEATNVEYIEFWMMDPFNEDANQNNPGKLYINLGDISEDILKDSRKSFENGLPTSELVENVDTTIWGRVSTLQNLVESFDNAEAARPYQDVGYDGLMDDDELSFYNGSYIQRIEQEFGVASDAYFNALDDPSGDNYHYYRGSDYDADDQYSSILERYKKYNGPDGNSPADAQNPEEYPTAGTTLPNVEDLNRDNTLSETERYFQYEIDLDPTNMEVGESYIADAFNTTYTPTNGDPPREITWYQFKVPISQPDNVIGNITDFKSIRFIRMFMSDFQQPVVCRFATLELVRGEWRRYLGDLLAPGEYIPDDILAQTTFDISTVNIEENGSMQPIPYRIPPGVERETNLGTTTFVRLNEQSMVMKVGDLVDGDARGAYKTANFDFRQYKRLKMYMHGHKTYAEDIMNYGDLTVFIRVGSDFTQNYYEYEVPVEFTEWGVSDAELIWPEINNFDIELAKLVQAKLNRDVQARDPATGISYTYPYVEYDGTNKITILGVPTISDVTAIMVGVRNPKKLTVTDTDDGQPKSAEIWINELRLSEFNDKSGWAGIIRASADLADLGKVVVSGMHRSPNFGALEMKINETERESTTQFDVATDLNLGKFFPEQAGVAIPMHFDYSQITKTPEYNPLNPDVKVDDELDTYEDAPSKDSVKTQISDYTQRRNINFVNVRKNRVGSQKKPKPWDIENFNASYAYTDIYHRNIDIDYDSRKTHQGGLGYTFSTNPKNVKPFQSIGSEYLTFIKDFNFFFLPKSFSFRTDMNREYGERKLRNKSTGLILIKPTYTKKWDWTRNYDLKFDLASSLSLTFKANAMTFIQEAAGSNDPNSNWYDEAGNDSIKDVRDQIFSGGNMRNYRQQLNANYKIPIDKLPFLDWITGQFSYGTTYDWNASPLSIQARLGNTVQNSRDLQLNGNFDLVKLYNKIGYLEEINSKGSQRGGGRQRGGSRPPEPKEDETAKDSTKTNYFKIIGDGVLRVLMSLRKASFAYTQSEGTVLPGFIPEPTLLGMDMSQQAPGWGFVFGSQADIRQQAGENGWITTDSSLNQPYMTKYSTNLSLKASLEVLPGLRIEVNADRMFTQNHTEYYRFDNTENQFKSYAASDAGGFSISYIFWGTAWNTDYQELESSTFEKLKENREVVADRLSAWNSNSEGMVFDSVTMREWPAGYGPTSQDVILPSFFAAYSNQSAEKVTLDYFPRIPLPNWRITYDGLKRLSFLANIVQSANLSHGYTGSYSIGSYKTNLYYDEGGTNYPYSLYDNVNSYFPEYDVMMVTITEQFSPIIGIDITWQNSLLTRFEIKKTRNLTFSMANKQLTDVNSDEFIVGLGYRIKDVSFTMSALGGGGKKTNISSDLDIKMDFSIRNNRTVLRRLDTNEDQVSAGQKIISINTTIDYMLNKSLTVALFFDKIINNPYVSNQYRNSTTKGGIKLRFSLAQ